MLFRSRAVGAVLVVGDGKYHAMPAIDLGFVDDDSQRRSEGGPRKEGKEVVEGGRDWTTGTNSRRSPEKDERSFSKRTPPVHFLDSRFLPTPWAECDGCLRACEGVPRNGAGFEVLLSIEMFYCRRKRANPLVGCVEKVLDSVWKRLATMEENAMCCLACWPTNQPTVREET